MGLSRPPALKAFTLADTKIMEQKQFELDLNPRQNIQETPKEALAEGQPALENRGYNELEILYRKKIGVSHRGLNRGELISSIQDPETEKARLKEIDDEDDHAERSSSRAGR